MAVKCPFCQNLDTRVIDSRLNQTNDITRRRRGCLNCERRFTTYERVEEIMPMVIKADGRREPYAREKLMGGLAKACQKRNIPFQKLEDITTSIERRVQAFGLKEIPSRTLGQMVMESLHTLDPVAYVRFASVYRKFKDVEEFVANLHEFPQHKAEDGSLIFPFAEDRELRENTLPTEPQP